MKVVTWRELPGGVHSAAGALRRGRSKAAEGIAHTVRVLSEDDLIEQGDKEAEAQSDEVVSCL